MPPPVQPRRPDPQPDPEKQPEKKPTCAWCDMPIDAGDQVSTDERDVPYHVSCLKAAVKLLARLRQEK